MGLFDFFKRKEQPSLLKEVNESLAAINKMFFPKGEQQEEELTNLLCVKLQNRYERQYVKNNYIFILTCLFMDKDKSSNAIVEKVKKRAINRLTTEDILLIYKFAIENNDRLSESLGIMLIMDSLCEGGTMEDEMPEGKGEFGLTKSNPIPIRGIPESEIYLRKLRLENGNGITWRRIGSCDAPNIPQLIDKYEIFDMNGQSVCYLYLCPYNKKTSLKKPKGFIFEGEPVKQTPQPQNKILPERFSSYVVKPNGNLKLVSYRQIEDIYTDDSYSETCYFLCIRHPLLVDITGQKWFSIPQIPDECDGIILKGYGGNNSNAYIVKNDQQALYIPVKSAYEGDIAFACLFVFSASWCKPSKLFIDEIQKAGIEKFTVVDVDKYSEYVELFRVKNIPTTILIDSTAGDSAGQIIKRWVGYDENDPGQTKLVEFLRKGDYYLLSGDLPEV